MRRAFYEEYWSGAAPPEDDATIETRRRLLEHEIGAFDRQLVLDAGCGSGIFLDTLKGHKNRVIGVDVSKTALDRARRVAADTFLCEASLPLALPFRKARFDVVWCSEVLEHLSDVYASLCELNRVTRVGGRLILTVPYHGLAKNVLIACLGFDKHFDPLVSHVRFFTIESISHCLELTGFHVVKVAGIGRLWPVWKSMFVVAQKRTDPKRRPLIEG
jgi:SAM-dependent methyltransferase